LIGFADIGVAAGPAKKGLWNNLAAMTLILSSAERRYIHHNWEG